MSSFKTRRSVVWRTLAVALCLVQLTGSVSIWAQTPKSNQILAKATPSTEPAKTPPPVTINRTVPKVDPPPAFPIFSSPPTDEEITRARVFEEPLIRSSKFKVQSSKSIDPSGENEALAGAITAYLKKGDAEDVVPFTEFLEQHPQSAWRVSLLTDLGLVYRKTGYFLKALDAWEAAWKLGRDETAAQPKAIVDRAVAELAELNARLGRFDRLETLLAEIGTRDVRGSAGQKLAGAREGFWMMNHKPGESFLCGPFALDRLRTSLRKEDAGNQKILAMQSDGSEIITAVESQEAREVAALFIKRLQETRNLKPILDELFVEDISDRLVNEASNCDSNCNCFPIACIYPPLVSFDHQVLSKLSREDLRRYYTAKFNQFYLSSLYGAGKYSMKSREDIPIEKLFPPGVAKILVQNPLMAAALDDKETSGRDEPEIKSVEQFHSLVATLEQAITLERQHLAKHPAEQTKQYKKNLSYLRRSNDLMNPRLSISLEENKYIPKGTRLIEIDVPLVFQLILFRDGRRLKIVSVLPTVDED